MENSTPRSGRAAKRSLCWERSSHPQAGAPSLDPYFLNAWKLQGIAYFYGSNYADALTAMQQFTRTAERMKSPANIGAGYNYMSYCFRGMNDIKQAKAYAMRAIAVLKTVPEDEDIANAYTGLASIYSDQDLVDSSMHYNRLGLAIFERTGNVLNATNTWLNLSENWMKEGRFDSSLYCLERARPGVEEVQEASTMAKFHGMMGRALLAHGRQTEAAVELELAEALAHEMDNAEDLGHIHDLQALSAAARGVFPEAFDYLSKARDAMVRDMDVRKAQELTEARMNFEHEQEKAQAESRLRQQRRQTTYALIGGGLLFVIAILLLLLYRFTRKSRGAVQREKDISDKLLLNILPAGGRRGAQAPGPCRGAPLRPGHRALHRFQGLHARQRAADRRPSWWTKSIICFKAFDRIMEKHGIEKIKTIGDAYMAAGGLPDPSHRAAGRRGARGHGDAGLHARTQGRARCGGQAGLRDARRHPQRAGGGGHRGREEVPVRHLGRHGEHRQPHGDQR